MFWRMQRFTSRHLAVASAIAAVLVAAAVAGAQSGRSTGATAGSAPQQVHANLSQLMRGLLFPNSNVIFFAQSDDPTKVKSDRSPSSATDPLAGIYGGWTAVEHSGLVIAEAANLLMIPGRRCANGKPVPYGPDWTRFSQGLRDAGMASYKAAQSKNADAMLEAANAMVTACANCHEKYRDNAQDAAGRCTP
jgi:hypothetical protein